MRRIPLAALLSLAAAVLLLPSCFGAAESENEESTQGEPPAGPVGRVTLSDTAITAAGLRTEPVTSVQAASLPAVLEFPGQVTFDSARIAVVSPRVAGRLESMMAVPGERVEPTDSVAFLSSPDYLAAENDLLQAGRRLELLEQTVDSGDARAMLDAARQRLTLVGATPEDVARLMAGVEPSLMLPLRPPFAGTVLEALSQPGLALEPGSPVYRVADLSDMHVVAQVPEDELARIRPGMEAEVIVRAYPTRSFPGRVARILEQLDPETRTARVVVSVPNPDRALKAGMFGSVRAESRGVALPAAPSPPPAAGAGVFLLPTGAVLTDGAERFVFVQVGPRTYERRDVQLIEEESGTAPSDRVVVMRGLSDGDVVVVEGGMVLRSELAKANLVDVD